MLISPLKICNLQKFLFNINKKVKFVTKEKIQDADNQFLSNLHLYFTISHQRELKFCIKLMLSILFSQFSTCLYEAVDTHLWKIYYTIEKKYITTLTLQFLREYVQVSILTSDIEKSSKFHCNICTQTIDIELSADWTIVKESYVQGHNHTCVGKLHKSSWS